MEKRGELKKITKREKKGEVKTFVQRENQKNRAISLEKKRENKGKRRNERTGHADRTYVIFDVDDEREDLNNHGENWKRRYLSDLFSLFFFISYQKQTQLQIIYFKNNYN